MRQTLSGVALALVVCSGCKGMAGPRPGPGPAISQTPTAEQLVNHLNQLSKGVEAIQAEGTISLKDGIGSVSGKHKLAFEKDRKFRLLADVLGKTVADVGSNEQEFWFWFKNAKGEDQPLAYCAYEDLPKVRLNQLQINPEWIIDALCVSGYGDPRDYQVRASGQNLELIRNTKTPQGDPVQKVTLVANAGTHRGRIIGHRLRDARGTELFAADIHSYQQVDGFVIPRKLTVRQSGQSGEVTITLDNAQVNRNTVAATIYTRPAHANEINLARYHAPLGSPQSYDKVRGNR